MGYDLGNTQISVTNVVEIAPKLASIAVTGGLSVKQLSLRSKTLETPVLDAEIHAPPARALFPHVPLEAWAPYKDLMEGNADLLPMSIGCFVVRSAGKTVLGLQFLVGVAAATPVFYFHL